MSILGNAINEIKRIEKFGNGNIMLVITSINKEYDDMLFASHFCDKLAKVKK